MLFSRSTTGMRVASITPCKHTQLQSDVTPPQRTVNNSNARIYRSPMYAGFDGKILLGDGPAVNAHSQSI